MLSQLCAAAAADLATPRIGWAPQKQPRATVRQSAAVPQVLSYAPLHVFPASPPSLTLPSAREASPGAPSFVEEGTTVAAGQTLCILEAMKLMNEVKSEIDGIVRVIHVGNGEPVEFGQLLFELEPVGGPPAL